MHTAYSLYVVNLYIGYIILSKNHAVCVFFSLLHVFSTFATDLF